MIDKIRADIVRRITDNTFGAKLELMDILSFLDTLEEPVSDDLEEAAEKFARFYDNGTCDGIAQDCFKAGAEWRKAKMMEWLEGKVNLSYGVATDAFVEVIDKLKSL